MTIFQSTSALLLDLPLDTPPSDTIKHSPAHPSPTYPPPHIPIWVFEPSGLMTNGIESSLASATPCATNEVALPILTSTERSQAAWDPFDAPDTSYLF